MNEQDIPIDIHANKLSDWLTSRRHCPKTWQTNILEIREKINNAIQDMPRHDGIVALLTGTHINYFHCLKIVEILKETEADSKNLFGRYGSQRMRDWQEVVKLYERDSIYLAEAAQMLQRNVSYEIPSIKKQISKLEQLQAECTKKETDCVKAEKNMLNEFNNQCKHLGIPGKKVKRELLDLLSILPELYESAAESTKSLKPAMELYEAFIEFTTGKTAENYFSLIKYVMENGNTTTFEWKYGEKPKEIQEPNFNLNVNDDENGNNDEIDFGDDIDFGTNEDTIDFDITVEESIDWGVETVSETPKHDESGIEIELGKPDSVATGEDAYTILDNPETRSKFIDELVELEAFLKMRLYELSTTSEMDALSQLQATGSTILQLQNTDSISAMLANVQGALVMMTNDRIQHLHSVKHSPKYVDYLAYTLDQKLTAVEKIKATQIVLQERRDLALEEQIKLQGVLSTVIKKTKELQEQIEEDISKRYKGREVNLMGGVNAL